MHSSNGRMLFVDLTTGEFREEQVTEETYRKFIGGYGLGAKVLYENMKPGIDPLGPENILGFLTGLLNGTGVIGSGRYTVVAKSPLTGGWGDANSGGHFAEALKRTGYDAVFFTGRSNKPVYLVLTDTVQELRDAGNIWGKDTVETEDSILEELEDKKFKIACIGPAGEKLSLISGIVNDKGRLAARSGLGAVMGSKNLKAIAVHGSKKVSVADSEGLKKLNADIRPTFKARPSKIQNFLNKTLTPLLPLLVRLKVPLPPPDQKLVAQLFSDYGTCSFVAPSAETQDSPIKNWSGVAHRDFPMRTKSSKISDDNIVKYVKKKFACSNCPVACGGIVEVKDGPYPIGESHKPEYETIAAFGSNILNDDLGSVFMANDMCNRAGIDSISAGSTIAFAIECYENGLITKEDTDGIALKWGDAEAMLSVLNKMVKREGFGDVLADGCKTAASKIGNGSERYAMHVGGQEIAMHDPRLNPGFGTTYVADPTPGRHTQVGLGYDEMGLGIMNEKLLSQYNFPKFKKYEYGNKGKKNTLVSSYGQIINCAGLCMFHFFVVPFYPLLDYIKAATGWDYTHEELMITGKRIQTIRQLFNVREGITPKDFSLPQRIVGDPPLSDGPLKGVTIDIEKLKSNYFKEMGWDYDSGIPSDQELKDISLEAQSSVSKP
ncbi:MAG: aldehyde ferredoxin oxidoreductase family protein [Thermodesulfobacteriota bacterium]|nr:aldehyde ferredoxin oxidoreductase family protein [Thermodesulfobacteriota bacterium]